MKFYLIYHLPSLTHSSVFNVSDLKLKTNYFNIRNQSRNIVSYKCSQMANATINGVLINIKIEIKLKLKFFFSDAIASEESVRITPSLRSQKGSIWSKLAR